MVLVLFIIIIVAENVEKSHCEAFEGEAFGELEDWIDVALPVGERYHKDMDFIAFFSFSLSHFSSHFRFISPHPQHQLYTSFSSC